MSSLCRAMITGFPDHHQNLRILVATGSTRSLHIRDRFGSEGCLKKLNCFTEHLCPIGRAWSVRPLRATSDHCRTSHCSQSKAVAECQVGGRRNLNVTRYITLSTSILPLTTFLAGSIGSISCGSYLCISTGSPYSSLFSITYLPTYSLRHIVT